MNDLNCIGRHLCLFVLFLLIAQPLDAAADSMNAVPKISVIAVEKLLDNPDIVIIDVRRKKSWWSSTTKIYGAVREDPSKVSEWVDKYPKTKTLFFYCD
jgi:hypothetical protein